LVAIVVPYVNLEILETNWFKGISTILANLVTMFITPIDGSSFVESVLALYIVPFSSTAIPSVNVPPTSIPPYNYFVSPLKSPFHDMNQIITPYSEFINTDQRQMYNKLDKYE